MRRHKACIIGLAVALVALAVMPILIGCGGGKTSADPFIGTWREQLAGGKTGSPPLVVTKAQDGYVATFVFWGEEMWLPPLLGPRLRCP